MRDWEGLEAGKGTCRDRKTDGNRAMRAGKRVSEREREGFHTENESGNAKDRELEWLTSPFYSQHTPVTLWQWQQVMSQAISGFLRTGQQNCLHTNTPYVVNESSGQCDSSSYLFYVLDNSKKQPILSRPGWC